MPDMLNENGRLVCMMVASMAAGVLANPVRIERNEPDMHSLVEMAVNFVQRVNTYAEFQVLPGDRSIYVSEDSLVDKKVDKRR